MSSSSDLTNVRDNMLTRMAMATPGGPTARMVPRFDEAQAFARSQAAVRKSHGLIAHPMLLTRLAALAVQIRERLDAGETVLITANGVELDRFEP